MFAKVEGHENLIRDMNSKAILNTDKINNIDSNNREIGNIKIMSYNECIENIRPYHVNKLKIINVLYELVYNYLKNNNNKISK